MSKLITYLFEAICISFMSLVIVGIVYGVGYAIFKAILMGVER
jgi:hypothetical protein